MALKTAENYVNYQERASEFAPGDVVVPFGYSRDMAGRVTAVWGGIGMIDVEFATGSKRFPVEELQKVDADDAGVIPPFTNSAPGGQPTVSVPGGPVPEMTPHVTLIPTNVVAKDLSAGTRRVAEAFVKKALYWSGPDRQYKATAGEIESGHYQCPKCKASGTVSNLRPAVYKRVDARSEKLLGCPECLFLVKKSDIVNCDEVG